MTTFNSSKQLLELLRQMTIADGSHVLHVTDWIRLNKHASWVAMNATLICDLFFQTIRRIKKIELENVLKRYINHFMVMEWVCVVAYAVQYVPCNATH